MDDSVGSRRSWDAQSREVLADISAPEEMRGNDAAATVAVSVLDSELHTTNVLREDFNKTLRHENNNSNNNNSSVANPVEEDNSNNNNNSCQLI